MKTVFFAKGRRGLSCLHQLIQSRHQCAALVLHARDEEPLWDEYQACAEACGFPVYGFSDPNCRESLEILSKFNAEVYILAGYGKIVRSELIRQPSGFCINLHGGKLPEYRGSSPLNWCLINGEKSCTVSIIEVDEGIDTGNILAEESRTISDDDTIADLHSFANSVFPKLMIKVLDDCEKRKCSSRAQDTASAHYYPRRFPEDGMILWDRLTAQQVRNMIRALTDPYPNAYTFVNGSKVYLKKASFEPVPFHGEPGRIYRISKGRVLVAASDTALWIDEALTAEGVPLAEAAQRYDRCLTTAFVAHKIACGEIVMPERAVQ